MGVIGVIKILEIFGYKSGVRLKDLVFISYAGMIRGSVAFGLVLRVEHSVINRPVIVTTSLFLVNTTTIVLGSTVATVQKILFGKEMAAKKEAEAMAKGLLEKSPHGDKSAEEMFLHPNLNLSNNAPQPMIEPKTKKGKCLKWFREYDKNVIKSHLIYNYDKEAQKAQQEYFDLMYKKGT